MTHSSSESTTNTTTPNTLTQIVMEYAGKESIAECLLKLFLRKAYKSEPLKKKSALI